MTLVTVTDSLQTSQKRIMKMVLGKTVKTVTNMRCDWFLSFSETTTHVTSHNLYDRQNDWSSWYDDDKYDAEYDSRAASLRKSEATSKLRTHVDPHKMKYIQKLERPVVKNRLAHTAEKRNNFVTTVHKNWKTLHTQWRIWRSRLISRLSKNGIQNGPWQDSHQHTVRLVSVVSETTTHAMSHDWQNDWSSWCYDSRYDDEYDSRAAFECERGAKSKLRTHVDPHKTWQIKKIKATLRQK